MTSIAQLIFYPVDLVCMTFLPSINLHHPCVRRMSLVLNLAALGEHARQLLRAGPSPSAVLLLDAGDAGIHLVSVCFPCSVLDSVRRSDRRQEQRGLKTVGKWRPGHIVILDAPHG